MQVFDIQVEIIFIVTKCLGKSCWSRDVVVMSCMKYSVLTGHKHDLTACKFVKNGFMTGELGASRNFPNFDLHL